MLLVLEFLFLPVISTTEEFYQIQLASLTPDSEQYYYAGAFLLEAHYGVYAHIYTINPTIPLWFNHLAEWDTIILSWDPLYWVQAGYAKTRSTWNVIRKYYVEKMDVNGYKLKYLKSASPSEWHSYKIVHAMEEQEGKYKMYINLDENLYWEFVVEPWASQALEAFVETTTTKICINGSHFKSLSYFDGRSWPYWQNTVFQADFPYEVEVISKHEFKAKGGG